MDIILAQTPKGKKCGIYILKGKTKSNKTSYYIGMTTHFTKRFKQHLEKKVKSTRKYVEIKPIAFRPTKTVKEARQLEYYWKKTIRVPKKAKQILEKQLRDKEFVEDWITEKGWKK